MAGLMYEGSRLPPQVSQAAQNYMNYQQALKAKLPLAVEGSGIPDSVRKAAQAAIERGPSAAAPVAEQAAGRGLMGTLGGVARAATGPAAAGLMALEPTMMGNGELSPEQREAQNPGQQADAQAYAQRVQDNALQASQLPPQGAELLQQGVYEPVPEETPEQAPQQSPMDVQNWGPQEAPQQPAPRQVEAQRQTVEQGTKAGLASGQVKVSELADGIVQADAKRAGVELTPEEHKSAVAEEVKALKTMDTSDMARYVSYALVAGGLIASALDKSGRTGQMFHESFNKQLDRNLAAGKMSQDFLLAQQKEKRENRKVDVNEKDVDSKITDRTETRGLKGREVDQGDTRLEQTAQRIKDQRELGEGQIAVGQQGNAIKSQGLMQRGQQFDQTYSQKEREIGLLSEDRAAANASREGIATQNNATKTAIADKKFAAASKESAKGVPLSFKDNQGAVKNFYKSQSLDIKPDALDAISSRLGTIQKSYPQLSLPNQIKLAEKELGNNLEREASMFPKDNVRIRQAK